MGPKARRCWNSCAEMAFPSQPFAAPSPPCRRGRIFISECPPIDPSAPDRPMIESHHDLKVSFGAVASFKVCEFGNRLISFSSRVERFDQRLDLVIVDQRADVTWWAAVGNDCDHHSGDPRRVAAVVNLSGLHSGSAVL